VAHHVFGTRHKGQACIDAVVAAAKLLEDATGVGPARRLAEDLAIADDNRIGGQDYVSGAGGDGTGLAQGRSLDERGMAAADGAGWGLRYGGSHDAKAKASGPQEVLAARRLGGENEHGQSRPGRMSASTRTRPRSMPATMAETPNPSCRGVAALER
jgi:hypothetical protein